MDELTQPQSSTLRFRREVADRFGVLPNFFCSAEAAPGLVEPIPTRFVQIPQPAQQRGEVHEQCGSVRISARITPPAGADIRHVSISVVDSGIGMSPELLPRVFELFTQGETRSSQPGLGIGLALARRLVELHAGRLDAPKKRWGEAASSSSSCPWRRPNRFSATEPHGDEQRIEGRILVVDDNQDAANATAMLIAEMGGDARVAYDGDSAIAMLQDYEPEVILLDIGMRGLDGYETCQRIRRLLGNRVLRRRVDRVRPGTGQREGNARRIRRAPDQACQRCGPGGHPGGSRPEQHVDESPRGLSFANQRLSACAIPSTGAMRASPRAAA